MAKSTKKNQANLSRPRETKSGSVFARLHYKINCDLRNNTQDILALDLLQRNVKKDLLIITTTELEEVFLGLLSAREQLTDQNAEKYVVSIVKKITKKFLSKHFGSDFRYNSSLLTRSPYVRLLLENNELLFRTSMSTLLDFKLSKFRQIFAPVYSYVSETFMESLLDNLILELSNCVVYLILVDFTNVYAFRQTVYQSRFLSLRNLERFKNNLSWQVKTKLLIQRPLDLYTNRYSLYIIRANGIYYRRVYANRSKEIEFLKGFPLVTILFIEVTDFLGSRFDELLYTLGNSIRLLFTSTLGQSIALIWRGIIEGLKKER